MVSSKNMVTDVDTAIATLLLLGCKVTRSGKRLDVSKTTRHGNGLTSFWNMSIPIKRGYVLEASYRLAIRDLGQ